MWNTLLWYMSQGAEIRLVPTLPVRMILQDERVAVVAADGEDPSQGALIRRGHGIVRALGALFERYWESGYSYATDRGAALPRRFRLTPAQAEIVAMMARAPRTMRSRVNSGYRFAPCGA